MARKLEVTIVGDASNVKRAFNDASGASRNFGSAIGTVAKIGAAAAVGGIAAVGVGLFKSVKAAQEAEVSQRRMATALEALGTSYSAHAQQIDTVIQKQSALAALDDEDLQDSFTRLARVVHGDVNEALRLNAIAADVARGKGIELEAATGIVTKAALGQVGSLKRQGIEIKAVTAAQDALKEAHGKVSEAQKKAAKEADLAATKQAAIAALQKTFAGAAKDYGESSAAAGERFGVALENIEEKIGAMLLPSLATLAGKASEALSFIDKLVTTVSKAPTLQLKFEVVKDAISNILFGHSEKQMVVDQDTLIVKYRTVQVPGLVDQIHDAIKKQSDAINWDDVTDKFLDRIKQNLRDTPRELAAIGPALRAIGTAMETALNDAGARFQDWWHGLLRDLPGAMLALGGAVVRGLGRALDPRPLARALADGVSEAISSAAKRSVSDARTVGLAIIRGVVAGLTALATAVTVKLGEVASSIAATASNAYGWAVHIGQQVVSGVLAGLGGLYGAVKGKIEGILGSVLSSINVPGFSPPEHAAQEAIGIPLGRGVILGFILGAQDLPAKMSEKIKAAIERGRQAVDAARTAFSTAFQRLAGDALAAFDAETDRLVGIIDRKLQATLATIEKWRQALTPSEKALADFDKAQREKGLRDDMTKAVEDYNAAVASGDAAAIAAAQERVRLADQAIARYILEQQAIDERNKKDAEAGKRTGSAEATAQERIKQLEADRALMRRHFEDQLAELEAMFTKSGATAAGKFKKAATDLFGQYGVSFKESGRDLGRAFGQGLIEAANAAAKEAARILDEAMRRTSGGGGGGGAGGSASASTMSPMLAPPAPSGGGTLEVPVFLDGREIARAVRDNFNEQLRSNPQLGTTF